MDMTTTTVDILIVGAGMTGLMAAQALSSQGTVLLLDKGAQVGGRLISHAIGPGLADLGAQFFTVRTSEFEHWSKQWLAAGLIKPWATGWSNASLTDITATTYPRYIVRQGMVKLAEYLARPLTVKTNACVQQVQQVNDTWQITTVDGRRYVCQALLLTPPVPISLQLLKMGHTQLTPGDQTTLQQVTYDPCLVALFHVEGGTKLPGLGTIQLPHAPIRYIVDNRSKGISPQAAIITVQTSVDFSRQLWNLPDEQALAQIEAEIQTYLNPESNIIEAQLHRWRYASPASLHPQRCLVAANLPPLLFAGDAFGTSGGIEGATLSGLAAANILLEQRQAHD